MKFTKILTVLLVLSLLLTGCGGASNGALSGSSAEKGYDGSVNRVDAPSTEVLDKETGSTQTSLPVNQKLIRKVYIDTETEELDPMLTQVEKKIAEQFIVAGLTEKVYASDFQNLEIFRKIHAFVETGKDKKISARERSFWK